MRLLPKSICYTINILMSLEDNLFNYVRLDGTWYVNAFEDIRCYSDAHDISANESSREITFTTTQAVPLDFYQNIVREFRGLKLYYEAHGPHMSLHGKVGGIHYAHHTQHYQYNNIAEYQAAIRAHEWVLQPRYWLEVIPRHSLVARVLPPGNIEYDILSAIEQN